MSYEVKRFAKKPEMKNAMRMVVTSDRQVSRRSIDADNKHRSIPGIRHLEK